MVILFLLYVESQWTPGVGDGQGGLACCDSWGRRESDTTERLIWSDLIFAAAAAAAAVIPSVVSDSVRPHRWQPTRLPCPWDSPGKNTGVGCYFLLQCMKVKSESEVAQSCLTLSERTRLLHPWDFPGKSTGVRVPLPSLKLLLSKL